MPKLFCGDLAGGVLKKIAFRRRAKKLRLNTIGHRLEIYKTYLKFKNQADMADHIHVSQGSCSGLIRDDNLPSAETIIRLFNIRTKRVSVEWLLTGRDRE
jgi:transcriptional regulator with XRE-family HTH domain